MDQKWKVPAIGKNDVLLGTPIIGWGPLFETPQALPENPEGRTASVEGEVWRNHLNYPSSSA